VQARAVAVVGRGGGRGKDGRANKNPEGALIRSWGRIEERLI